MRRAFSKPFAVLLVVVFLAGCAGSPAPVATTAPAAPAATSAPVATTAPAATAAPAATIAPTAATAPEATAAPSPVPTQVAGPLKDVPRNRTFVTQGWDLYTQLSVPTNMSPYSGALLHPRNILHYTINESLFYSNYNTGEIIPWLGEKWQYNADNTEVTVTIRKGAKWSDGEPYTAEDVAFTLDMLKANAPEMLMSGTIKEWVKEAVVVDPQTVRIVLTKPGPRWARETLATGQAARFVVVPKHIWKDVADPKTFEFFDMAKGWPVGTGPYKLVKTGSDSMIFDRRDSWWAIDAGVATALPEIERIVYVPASADALPQLYTNNDLDAGYFLQIGAFEAAKARNPKLISWSEGSDVAGFPNGCVYRLTMNDQKPPFDDPDVRWAINYAINRDQFADLAYEGSVTTTALPFSSYGGVQAYVAKMQDLIDKYQPGLFDPAKTEELLTKKGFTKGSDGKWLKPDGSKFQLTIHTLPANPGAPVIVQQLQDAGFDAVQQISQSAPFTQLATSGDFETHLWVHCGSAYDPWQTLEHFHSKYAKPAGTPITNVRAYTRYANPELDAILNQMEKSVPSVDDPAYMDLVRQATEIFMRDMIEIDIAGEYQVIPMNTTYWTGWPTAQDPYAAPVPPWDGYASVIYQLKAAQ